MHGMSILMAIFGICIILAGLYIYTGHNSHFLMWKGYNPKATKEDLKHIGTITMLTSIIPFIIAIIGLFIGE